MMMPEATPWSAQSPHFLAYLHLRQEHPELFDESVDGGLKLLLDPVEIARAEHESRRKLAAKGLPPGWASVGLVFEDEYLVVVRDAVRFPDGAEGTYVRVLPQNLEKRPVAVLPVCEGKLVLIHHYRHATRSWQWEIPRGFGNSLDPRQTAVTELAEELGAEPERLVELGLLHLDSGMLWHEVALFFAEISHLRGPADQHEPIDQVRAVTQEDLEHEIADGCITDSFTIAAYTRAKLRGLVPP